MSKEQVAQTRSEENGLKWFPTLREAFIEAKHDRTVWKVSTRLPNGEQVRLVRRSINNSYEWFYESIFGSHEGWENPD